MASAKAMAVVFGLMAIWNQPAMCGEASGKGDRPAGAKPLRLMLADDAFPAGANVMLVPTNPLPKWITSTEGPVLRGNRAFRVSGKQLAQGFYQGGAALVEVLPGSRFSVNIFIDPLDPPRMVMLQVHTNGWKHRAMWGDPNAQPTFGKPNTGERFFGGPLPESGRWMTVEVMAEQMDLQPGQKFSGIALTLDGGTAYFDAVSMISGL